MKIVNLVNVSLLSNEMQERLAKDYDLSDASQHMLAQTEDGKFFLLKDVHLASLNPPGGDNDPKDVTFTIKSDYLNNKELDNSVERMMLLWQSYLKGEGHE